MADANGTVLQNGRKRHGNGKVDTQEEDTTQIHDGRQSIYMLASYVKVLWLRIFFSNDVFKPQVVLDSTKWSILDLPYIKY